jgi:hypothetical protein
LQATKKNKLNAGKRINLKKDDNLLWFLIFRRMNRMKHRYKIKIYCTVWVFIGMAFHFMASSQNLNVVKRQFKKDGRIKNHYSKHYL